MTDHDSEHGPTADVTDPIVAEVRAQREAIVAAAGGDPRRIYADLKLLEQRERAAGRVILTPPKISQSEAAA
ncbi:MAG: hypothetical protein A2Y95_01390 [Deltaproteobacteria bacterium RBG_13_65_10]|jgi:hypothetical protein|nr:MAG: hypothetical protein A2Y95_01390 [Deltaproteobacteria bacterium RBG_13_65_10]